MKISDEVCHFLETDEIRDLLEDMRAGKIVIEVRDRHVVTVSVDTELRVGYELNRPIQ